MKSKTYHIPPEIRAAISVFLNECQREARPFQTSQALSAVRRIFPDLDISDEDLVDAISSEAALAGFDIAYAETVVSEWPSSEASEQRDTSETAPRKRTQAQRHIDTIPAGQGVDPEKQKNVTN